MQTPLLLCLFWVNLYEDITFPQPTPQISKLVENLGSPVFHERVKATKKLIEIGAPAIRACEYATYSHDLEVSSRAMSVINEYYNVAPSTTSEYPSMWSLPEKFTLSNGHVLKWRKGFRRAYLRQHIPIEQHWDWDFNGKVDREATSYFVRMLLRNGVPKKDVQALLDQMVAKGDCFNGMQKRFAWNDVEEEKEDEEEDMTQEDEG